MKPAEIAWAPVETVSLSEAGFERIYQGSALLFAWPLQLPARADVGDVAARRDRRNCRGTCGNQRYPLRGDRRA